MSAAPSLCAETVTPLCLYLAERWRHADTADDRGHRELEMATVLMLRWIASGDHTAEAKVRKTAAALKLAAS
jgi:hypothetical protein